MSYNDLTKIRVFLPYCGMFTLPTNEVMGASLNLKYIIDILTGACLAEIQVKRNRSSYLTGDPDLNAPMYRFSGNIFQQVPISAVDYSGIINAQMGILQGAASVVSSGNPLNGAVGMAGSLLNAAMAHPNVEHVGSSGSSYGYMGCQQPFLIQEYPTYNMPSNYNNYYGAPIFDFYSSLHYVDGYTLIDSIWMDAFDQITSEEEDMLKQICSSGIYIDHSSEYEEYDPKA